MSAVHTQRGFGGLAYLVVACGLGLYFTFAAVQGDYGMFARVAINAEAEGLRAEREGRSVEIRIDPLPDCRGDGVLLGQVWSNLLSNALKYTRRKPLAVIEVSGWSEAGIPSYSVRDNGAGFDMRYVHTLFGVFRRLHRAEEFEGTGVGLALAKRIVQRHGGTIWGEGEVGKGARFTFTVPGLPAGGPAPGEKQA